MPVTPDKPGPYTSPQVVIDLIERHRTRGLPSPVTPEVLARAGVSESLIPRTLQSLVGLDLINDDGRITDIFEGIRLAPHDEYQTRLREWLNATYSDVLAYADPATDDLPKIRDAFRLYKPVGQQDRMVTLFLKLCAAAGVQTPKNTAAPAAKSRQAVARLPAPRAKTPTPAQSKEQQGTPAFVAPGGLPPALAGLLASLPKNGEGWTQERRDKFVTTFGAVVDFCFPIMEQLPAPMETAADQ